MSKGVGEIVTRERMMFLTLATAAILGRWALVTIPNVQPVTILVIMGGALLGWRRGVGLALLVTLVTNLQLGSGTWSVFQAIGWALAAAVGAKLSSTRRTFPHRSVITYRGCRRLCLRLDCLALGITYSGR